MMTMQNDASALPQSGEIRPPDWKGMDDFAAGIDGNRLPGSSLAGSTLRISQAGGTELELAFRSPDRVAWRRSSQALRPDPAPAAGRPAPAPATPAGEDWYEHVAVRPGVHFLTLTYAGDPLRADVIVVCDGTGRTLTVSGTIAPEPTPGRPRVSQRFEPGTLAGTTVSGAAPVPSRDIIGWRALYRYSPEHLYEHVYLSSERYAWQCLAGEQRGHGDVDLATTWGLGDSLYVFTFREFLIPVAATWLYDLDAMRSTGTFFGLGARGQVRCAPGGAFITGLGRVAYPDEQPV